MKNLVRSYQTWRTASTTRHQLNRLSDRELEDVGMARGDIETVVQKAIAGKY